MSDKKWLEANYSRVKDDTVLLSCLRDNHIENLKFELGVFALGLATLVIMLMLAACTNTGYYIFVVLAGALVIMTIQRVVSRAHCCMDPKRNEQKYLGELSSYDASEVRAHIEKSCYTNESIEAIIALTDFYVDG